MREFFIRTDDPDKSIDVKIAENKTIGDLKRLIKTNANTPNDQRVRIFHVGKEYTNDKQSIKDAWLNHNKKITIHASFPVDTISNEENADIAMENNSSRSDQPPEIIDNDLVSIAEGFEIIIKFLTITITGSFIGAGLDCFIYGNSFLYNMEYGKINNFFILLCITAYLSTIAYQKKNLLGKVGLLALLPITGYFISSALVTQSISPLKIWKSSVNTNSFQFADNLAVLILVTFMATIALARNEVQLSNRHATDSMIMN